VVYTRSERDEAEDAEDEPAGAAAEEGTDDVNGVEREGPVHVLLWRRSRAARVEEMKLESDDDVEGAADPAHCACRVD
jgi:hypothetical protein